MMKFRLKADAIVEAANLDAALFIISGYFNRVANMMEGERLTETVFTGPVSVRHDEVDE